MLFLFSKILIMKTNPDFNEEVKQNIINFSQYASTLKIKLDNFRFPEKILGLLTNNLSEIAKEVKTKIICLVDLYDKLSVIKLLTEEKWFWYKSKNWNLARNISDYNFSFTEKQIWELDKLVSLMEWFYKTRIELLKNNIDIKNLFLVKDTEILNLLEVPLFTRLDLLLDDTWNFKIAEMEPIYAWIWEALWTREVFSEIQWNDLNFNWLINPFLNSMKRFKWKNFLFLPNPLLSWYYSEVKYVFEKLYPKASIFCELNLCLDSTTIDFKDNWLYFEWKKVDIIMDYIIPKEQKELTELDSKIISLYKKWKLKLFPEPSLELDSKLWLALAQNKKYFWENNELTKFLPKTTIFSQKDIISESTFLKRAISRVWEKDVILNPNKKDIEVISWDKTPWIIQEKVKSTPKEVVLLTRKWRIEKVKMFSRIELYIFFWPEWAEFWDILITMSQNEIVKWWNSCIMVPWMTKS